MSLSWRPSYRCTTYYSVHKVWRLSYVYAGTLEQHLIAHQFDRGRIQMLGFELCWMIGCQVWIRICGQGVEDSAPCFFSQSEA
jgi:hypothetical protein